MSIVKNTNFEVGSMWISKKRKKFRIVSIDESPTRWYPLLLEEQESKVLVTATITGEMYSLFQDMEDKLVMKIPGTFNLSMEDKDVADRMLKVYNKRVDNEAAERKRKNDSILRALRIKPRER